MTITERLPQHEGTLPPPPRGWSVVHDFAFTVGGAERVSALLALEVAVDGPLVTLGGRPEVFASTGVDDVRVRHPRLFGPRHYRQLSLLVPALSRVSPAVEGNVLASSYAFAHHVRATGSKVVYCHTPLRQVWSGAGMYAGHAPAPVRAALGAATAALRHLDRRAARDAAAYVANSRAVARRIEEFYGIEPAAVAYPPHDALFHRRDVPRGDHYVWAGRIVEPYKRLEPLLEAFRSRPHLRLDVIGDGRDAARLRALAPANVRFLGTMDTAALADAYARARAVLFPSEDDFGLVPVEAMATGTPVVALGRGGALETVVDGLTGVLFDESTPELMAAALDRFESEDWDEQRIAAHAEENFGREAFIRTMRSVLRSV